MKGYTNPTIRSTEDGETVGPKMHGAVRLVALDGFFPSMNQLAISVGPHGSQQYGYQIVNRCLSKRLLKIHPGHPEATPQARGAVVLTDKGARYLNEHTHMDLDPDDYVPSTARWDHVEGRWELPAETEADVEVAQ